MGVLQLGVWVWGWGYITFQAIWSNKNKDVEARKPLATCKRTKDLCVWVMEHPGDIGWTCHVLETRFWIVSHWKILRKNSLSIFVVEELPEDGVWDKVIMKGWKGVPWVACEELEKTASSILKQFLWLRCMVRSYRFRTRMKMMCWWKLMISKKGWPRVWVNYSTSHPSVPNLPCHF